MWNVSVDLGCVFLGRNRVLLMKFLSSVGFIWCLAACISSVLVSVNVVIKFVNYLLDPYGLYNGKGETIQLK